MSVNVCKEMVSSIYDNNILKLTFLYCGVVDLSPTTTQRLRAKNHPQPPAALDSAETIEGGGTWMRAYYIRRPL